ncbi:MAG TPA: hypothetical protein VHV10_11590, partial [Ktedonobacteraceae bacterium]|nr:hypothetical protein [Ktedonobacteraceae bacterium]
IISSPGLHTARLLIPNGRLPVPTSPCAQTSDRGRTTRNRFNVHRPPYTPISELVSTPSEVVTVFSASISHTTPTAEAIRPGTGEAVTRASSLSQSDALHTCGAGRSRAPIW